MRKREKTNPKSIKRGTVVVFLITLVIVMGVTWLLNENQVKREKLKATYTAESTVSRVESQLSKYLAESDLVKRVLEKGYDIDSEQVVLNPSNTSKQILKRNLIQLISAVHIVCYEQIVRRKVYALQKRTALFCHDPGIV